MAKTGSITEYCTSCVHFGYCMVYWGVECKRQGGKKIPRMKPTPLYIIESNARKNRSEQMQITMHKPDNLTALGKRLPEKPKISYKQYVFKKMLEILEPIRTKVANW